MSALLFAICFILLPGIAAYLVGRLAAWLAPAPLAPRSGADWANVAILAAVASSMAAAHYGAAEPRFGTAESRVGALVLLLAAACLCQLVSTFLPKRKWIVLIPGVALAAWLATRSGVAIDSVKLPFGERFVHLGSWSAFVTVGWALLVVGAFGTASHVRGAPLAIGTVVATGMLLVCVLEPQVTGHLPREFAAALAAGCLGALVALRPARDAAGSSGFLAVGLGVAALSILGALKNTAFLIAVLPLMLVGVPLLDVTYAVLYRRRRGETALAIESRSQRLHDILEAARFSESQILRLYVLASIYLTALAVFLVALIRVHFAIKLLILGVALPAGAVLLWVIGKSMRRTGPEGAADQGRLAAWNVQISGVTMDGSIAAIDEFIQSRSPHHVVTSDASSIVRAQEDEEFREVLNRADMVTPDGVGVVWMGRLLDLPLYERVSGCDMVERIAGLAAAKGYSIYLLGARPGVAEKAGRNLQGQWPGLRIAGAQHGYFSDEEEPGVLEAIREAKPDVLFVALGIPRQEKWIRAHLEDLGVPVAIGVGGSFDVIAGEVKRAPRWVQRMGLEWLYRTVREPRRLPRLLTLPRLFWMTVRAAWEGRRAR